MFKVLDDSTITLKGDVVATAADRKTALRICTLLNFARNFPDEIEDIKTDLSANLISLVHHSMATIRLLERIIDEDIDIKTLPIFKTDLETYKALMARFNFPD